MSETDSFVAIQKDHNSSFPGAGVDWLDDLRGRGLAGFREHGFPTTREENWKYTNVGAVTKRNYELGESPSDATVSEVAAGIEKLSLEGQRAIFVDGHFVASLSTTDSDASAGVRCRSLAAALEETPTELKPYLGRTAALNAEPFVSLNTAFLCDGAVVEISGTSETPLHIVNFSSDAEATQAHPRNLIVARTGGRAVVVETFVSLGSGVHLTNAVTEVVMETGSNVDYYRLQTENVNAYHIGSVQISQAAGSEATCHAVSLGARLHRCDINVALNGPGAQCTLNGFYLARGRQHTDFHTRIDHFVPECTSAELFKGILDDRGRAVFNGRAIVHPNAQRTVATQANHNLLLSLHAEIDTKPQLEIFADDVSCSHGATVGQLDENMLFYLRSRGLPESLARIALIYGFTDEVLKGIAVESVRRCVTDSLAEALPEAAESGLLGHQG